MVLSDTARLSPPTPLSCQKNAQEHYPGESVGKDDDVDTWGALCVEEEEEEGGGRWKKVGDNHDQEKEKGGCR